MNEEYQSVLRRLAGPPPFAKRLPPSSRPLGESGLRRTRRRGKPGNVHLVGICGVGMAGLAFHLKQKGFKVSGCDLKVNRLATWLESVGIKVQSGHDPAHLADVEWIIRTGAVRPDHPEIAAALGRGLPVSQRGLVLAALLKGFFSVIVCGSHGKTTTTAMLTQILTRAGHNPSFCIGGESALGVAGVGDGKILVAEGDESDGTLAHYQPDIAIVTNIEFDHAEHFADLAALRECFRKMLAQVRQQVIFCRDDPEASKLCRGLPGSVSYGFSALSDWRAAQLQERSEGISFQVWHGRKKLGIVNLPAPGRHNALNALAAGAAASVCGVEFALAREGLEAFQPVRRRFERLSAKDDVLVISDYAHHPSEIAAILKNLPRLKRKRSLAVFQPHRYSRTRALASEFAAVFKGLDELVLAPVYAASESSVPGGTHWELFEKIRQIGQIRQGRTFAASSLEQAWGYLRTTLRPGDGLLIIGAGDVEQIAAWAKREIAERGRAALDPARAWAAELAKMRWEATTFQRQASLAKKTTLRVGGAADILAEVASEPDLIKLLRWANERQVPFTLLGAGSNVLVSDLGARGVVVRLIGPVFGQVRREASALVVAGAGAPIKKLTGYLAAEGLSGLEFLTGIPGSVGGALRMNAGAFGEEVGSRVVWVRFLNPDGSVQVADAAKLAFGYRCSAGLAGKVVLEAAFQVGSSNPQAVRKRMAATSKRRSKSEVWPSAGSVFRNPESDFAGRLLERCGVKGRRVGGALVSEKHANIIVTERGATASDVRALLELMRVAVRQKFGIDLKEELVCLE